jgi:Protein of unknown function (DUF1822)
MNSTNIPLITVPLGGEVHRLAQQWAGEAMQLAAEPTRREIGKRVYLNTLAVYAVHSYLRWQAYEIDISQGDIAHPMLRSRWDVADLVIPSIGKLECRPVWQEEAALALPPEVTEDRIGYVAVQLGEQLDLASMQGFAPAVDPSMPPAQMLLENLQPFDALINYLYRLEVANEFLQSDDPVAVRVREALETSSMPEIVAQLERIYRNEPEDERPYAVKDILAGDMTMLANSRESIAQDENEFELLELAESLVEKLGEIWEDAT